MSNTVQYEVGSIANDEAFYVSIHRYGFRPGEPGRITGLHWHIPKPSSGVVYEARLCYQTTYADGFVDYHAVKDTTNYKIITGEDVIANRLPPITQ